MKILVLNAGSSSIKYQVFGMDDQQVLIGGLVDRIGEKGAVKWRPITRLWSGLVLHLQAAGMTGIDAIGHRVVHGGERLSEPALIDADVVDAIRDMIPLAPLHNPANLEGIEVAQQLFPGIPQVAVFDTAFHQTMPPVAFRYALPASLYREQQVQTLWVSRYVPPLRSATGRSVFATGFAQP